MTVSRSIVFLATALLFFSSARAQKTTNDIISVHKKHVLVIGEANGWHHDSIPDAMAAVYNMGKPNGSKHWFSVQIPSQAVIFLSTESAE